MNSKAPRTGRLARTAIAGTAVARAGMAQLSHRLQSRGQDLAPGSESAQLAQHAHEAQLGRILFGALNQLKGTALKAAQLLSMELDLLPEGLRLELAKAQYQVTPLNRALVIKLLRQEFGAGPETLFASFETQAFAAASLGQVHGATLADGRELAVKLQYPGMAASIHSDMRLLRLLLSTLGPSQALPRAAVLDSLLNDIEATLAEELDYLHEAEQLHWFGEQLAAQPALRLPQPVAALSSRRVLTMERLPGLHLKEWLATGPSQAERDRYGQLLFDLFLRSVFELQRLQADPHPGNSLFMPNGQLGLLDFGCTRRLSPAFCQHLRAAWCGLLRRPCDTAALHQAYLGLGLLQPELSHAAFCQELLPALQGILDWQLRPFTQELFDFGLHPPPPRTSAEYQRTAVGHLHTMAAELPYFDRAYLGLLQMLRDLGARVRTQNAWIQA
ncbi:ABC1 kinase family protein [Paucibacter sp. DJ2R-2]|uniref:ABC1 kinase family protein n=1 Tax=Paucibacter sp. DJ2R-2 TaxID=2893558 RepID=UPI0021E39E28|nr:AarF/ABC1/UbiB kinase family protein [Paucibacter sp. DJ2R-2]MCV2419390.1 AarF/ABC1/UbiB kinase family protein [Paucibacter sp. DJ4R-1]MCV2437706.1 AarF/ABC1/UbiB kinase family protein [Paucibacter sp. DJ2R-2]